MANIDEELRRELADILERISVGCDVDHALWDKTAATLIPDPSAITEEEQLARLLCYLDKHYDETADNKLHLAEAVTRTYCTNLEIRCNVLHPQYVEANRGAAVPTIDTKSISAGMALTSPRPIARVAALGRSARCRPISSIFTISPTTP